MEGNLFGAYEAIIPRLTTGLPVPFRLEGDIRVDNTPRHIALREALINLLIHADYTDARSSLIFRSPAGFLFQNPGSSRAPEADIGFGRPYEPRNPSLVFMFRQINLAEEAGSGIPRIRQTWRELGYRAPEIDVGIERYEFSLQLSHVHLVPDEDRTWLQSLGQDWQEPEQLALLMARHDGDVDNARLRSVTSLHPADATKVLGSLRNQGLLTMTGWGRGASYQLSAEASMLSPGASILPAEASMLGPGASILPAATGTETAPSAAESPSLVATFTTWVQLERIAAEVHGRRVPRSTLRQVVLGLCVVQPLSVQELAELTRRGATYIGQMVVGPLVAEGLLERRYPNQPSHPDQRYVTLFPKHDDTTTDTEGDAD